VKLWERSLSQALGQCEAARRALVSVCGHIMPDSCRERFRRAQHELEEAERELNDIAREQEVTGFDVPWERKK